MNTALHKYCLGENLSQDHKERFMERALEEQTVTIVDIVKRYNDRKNGLTFPAIHFVVCVCPPSLVWDTFSTLFADVTEASLQSLEASYPTQKGMVQQLCTVTASLLEQRAPVMFVWTTDGVLTPVLLSQSGTAITRSSLSDTDSLLALIDDAQHAAAAK